MSYSKEQRIINQVRGYTNQDTNKPMIDKGEQRTPVASGLYLPNHSGLSTHKEFDHTLLSNIGTNTHAQIDTHIADSSDPHGATLTQTNATITTATITNPIKNLTNYVDFTILDPNGVYSIDTQVFIMWAPADLTITKIQVECSSAVNLNCDLKWADDFITLANATVIDVLDTGADGKITITSGFDDATIASGKAIYLQLDATPSTSIAQVHVHIEYDFD